MKTLSLFFLLAAAMKLTAQIPIKGENGLTGFVNEKGEWVIQPQYESGQVCRDGVCAASKDGKVMILTTSGKEINTGIENIIFPAFTREYLVVEEKVAAGSSAKFALLNYKGTVLIPAGKYERILSAGSGLIVVKKDGKYGAIDITGKVRLPMDYDFLGSVSDGMIVAGKNNKYGLIDLNGNILHPMEKEFSYFRTYEPGSEGRVAYTLAGKQGFLDSKGNVVIPASFVNVGLFKNGLAKVTTRGNSGNFSTNYGVVDPGGKEIVKPEYEEVYLDYARKRMYAAPVSGRIKYLDFSGKEFVARKLGSYEVIGEVHDLNVVSGPAGLGLATKAGKLLSEVKYTRIYPLENSRSLIVCSALLHGRYVSAIYHTNGSQVAGDFINYLSIPTNGVVYVSAGARNGYITESGKMFLNHFTAAQLDENFRKFGASEGYKHEVYCSAFSMMATYPKMFESYLIAGHMKVAERNYDAGYDYFKKGGEISGNKADFLTGVFESYNKDANSRPAGLQILDRMYKEGYWQAIVYKASFELESKNADWNAWAEQLRKVYELVPATVKPNVAVQYGKVLVEIYTRDQAGWAAAVRDQKAAQICRLFTEGVKGGVISAQDYKSTGCPAN